MKVIRHSSAMLNKPCVCFFFFKDKNHSLPSRTEKFGKGLLLFFEMCIVILEVFCYYAL